MRVIIPPSYPSAKILVDDEDYNFLVQFSWYLDRDGYPCNKSGEKQIRMHNLLIKDIPDEAEVDHRDRLPLNNQKSNLRAATNSQQRMNQEKVIGGSSVFKGVKWHNKAKKWAAQIQKDYKQTHLGLFTSEIEAARAYNKAAIELFGEFACLNIIPGKEDGK